MTPPPASLLPARLTPIEEYFLEDDSPAYPMTVLIRMRFSGRLNRVAFEEAVADLVERNSLLRAVVRSKAGGTPSWESVAGWLPRIRWDARFERGQWPQVDYIDVRTEPGTRIWVSTHDGQDEVIIQVHHSCADAMGMCRLTEDLMIAYDHRVSNQPDGNVRFGAICSRRFRRRSTPALPAWLFTMMAHRWLARVRDCLQIVCGESCPLLPDDSSGENRASVAYPTVEIMRFDRQQTREIINTARSRGATVNSLLLRDLYLAVRNWRASSGYTQLGDTIRFCVPVNLRTELDDSLPVTNALSFLFLDRDDDSMRCEDKLLAGLQREVHSPQRRDLRLSFVTLLRIGRNLPGGMRSWLNWKDCWATCLVSNLGVLFKDTALANRDQQLEAGGLTLESWDLVPPLRNQMGLTICPYSYAGRLSIVMHYDSSRMERDQLEQLLKSYRALIERSCLSPANSAGLVEEPARVVG